MAILQQTFGPLTWSSSATNLSVTSSLEIPGTFLYVYLVIPTMTSGYNAASNPLYIQGSADNVSFYRVTTPFDATVSNLVGTNDLTVGSGVSSRIVQLAGFSMRYMKIETSGAVTNPTQLTAASSGFKVICISNQ